MSLLTVGSVAFDAIETPFGKTDKIIGGAATYIALSSSYFTGDQKIVSVVGDDFPNETLSGPIPSSIEFMLNMVDWLILDEDILSIRAKKIDPRRLDPIEDSLKAPIKYFAMLFPPFLVVVFGLIRWRARKSLRTHSRQKP